MRQGRKENSRGVGGEDKTRKKREQERSGRRG